MTAMLARVLDGVGIGKTSATGHVSGPRAVDLINAESLPVAEEKTALYQLCQSFVSRCGRNSSDDRKADFKRSIVLSSSLHVLQDWPSVVR